MLVEYDGCQAKALVQERRSTRRGRRVLAPLFLCLRQKQCPADRSMLTARVFFTIWQQVRLEIEVQVYNCSLVPIDISRTGYRLLFLPGSASLPSI